MADIKKPTLSLDLTQTQTLVMTPQLQQAISLLQLSNLELNELLDKELEQNPLLEREDPAPKQTSPDDSGALSSQQIGDHLLHRSSSGGLPADIDMADMNIGKPVTLREHLMSQVNVDCPETNDKLIAAQLIEQLDESGYIRDDLDQIAERFGCSVERIEQTLEIIQKFDPPGIFSRNLEECLSAQLEEQGQLTASYKTLLQNLDLAASHKMGELAKLCGVDDDTLKIMLNQLRTLNPKPASSFQHEVTQTIIPDVFMRPKRGGGWIVELNNETLPKVLVNEQYYAEISDKPTDKQEKQYLSEKLQAANWLVKALHQRATTIIRVATEIVRKQEAFFVYGIEYLKPLILKDIALKLEIHESTVSRVTTNKYISTPRGLYELKYFFTTALASTDGGQSFSAEAIRHRLKQLIEAETMDNILSDDDLADALKTQGVDIARRTIAKYREAMNIPSSSVRRRQKKSQQNQ